MAGSSRRIGHMAEYGSNDGRWFVRPTELPTLNFKQFKPHIRFSAANEYSNHGSNIHHISITTHDPNNSKADIMGHIEWHKKTGEILGVRTHEEYRRMGVANTLFHEARKISREQGLVAPEHSHDRSDMGDAWAKQAGGKVPPRGWISSYSQ